MSELGAERLDDTTHASEEIRAFLLIEQVDVAARTHACDDPLGIRRLVPMELDRLDVAQVSILLEHARRITGRGDRRATSDSALRFDELSDPPVGIGIVVVPDQSESAPGFEYAGDLGEGSCVFEPVESLADQNGVERVVRVRDRFGRSFDQRIASSGYAGRPSSYAPADESNDSAGFDSSCGT